MASKTDLLNLLDKHVFHPILNKSERDLSERERQDLHDLQRRTEEEKARFHGYDSAERLVATYKEDLSSEIAKPFNARLQDLHLPTLADVRDEFLKLAGEDS